MADGFDPVAVGIAQERCVIVAQSRRAVIAAAGRYPCVPERIDLGPPFRLETPVAAGGILRFGALADGNIDPLGMRWPRSLAIAQPVVAAADFYNAEHMHDGVVEAFGGCDIRYGNGDVIQHRIPC